MRGQTRRYKGGDSFDKLLKICPITKTFNEASDTFNEEGETDKQKALGLRITTLLGHLARRNMAKDNKQEVLKFDLKEKKFINKIPKTLEYMYEAMLCQCAFLSRLIYSPTDIFLQGVAQGMELLPKVKNELITTLEYKSYTAIPNFKGWFLSNNIPVNTPIDRGKFYPISNTAVFQYYNSKSNINKRRTVYVVCKGTSKLKEALTDLRFDKTQLANLPVFYGAPGYAHSGFLLHIRDEINDILASIQAYALPDVAKAANTATAAKNAAAGTNEPSIQPTQAEQIIITGHSLGGASATLIALALAHAKIPDLPPIHCITFGAPKLLSDDSRIYFNEFLLNGTMTYDRVVVNNDWITNVPPGPTVHPGFRLLNLERAKTTFKNSGRSGYIDHIRKMAANIESKGDEVQWSVEQHPILKDIYDTKFKLDPVQMTNAAKEATSAPINQPKNPNGGKQGGGQVGGLALTKAASVYKNMTKFMQPNTVNYECSAKISKGFCHCGYMQIGFAAALQLPVGPGGFMPRDSLGERTMFISDTQATLVDTFAPSNRMYVISANPTVIAGTPAATTATVGTTAGGATKTRKNHRNCVQTTNKK